MILHQLASPENRLGGGIVRTLYGHFMNKEKKQFKGYKRREIRMSDEVWEKLKAAKLKSAKTWNNFIKQLNKTYENS